MPEDFVQEHEAVFAEATALFKQRSQVRGQMWLDWPPSDKLREMKERMGRMEHLYQEIRFEDTTPGPEDPYAMERRVLLEDAIDMLNYTNFFIKQIRRGQRG